eukprot:g2340.t1
MGVLSCISKTILTIINVVFVICGLALIGLPVYGIIQWNQVFAGGEAQGQSISNLVGSPIALYAMIGIGSFMFVLSLIGLIGTHLKKAVAAKTLLTIYLVFVFLLLVASILLIAFLKLLTDDAKKAGGLQTNTNIQSVKSQFENGLSGFFNCSYNYCCGLEQSGRAQGQAVCTIEKSKFPLAVCKLQPQPHTPECLANDKGAKFREADGKMLASNFGMMMWVLVGVASCQGLAFVLGIITACSKNDDDDQASAEASNDLKHSMPEESEPLNPPTPAKP